MLKSMQLLPDAAITAKTSHNFHLDNKGKRKASDSGDGSHARKKVERDYVEDEDPQDEVGNSSNVLQDMQTDD